MCKRVFFVCIENSSSLMLKHFDEKYYNYRCYFLGLKRELKLVKGSGSYIKYFNGLPHEAIDGNRTTKAVTVSSSLFDTLWLKFILPRKMNIKKVVILYMYIDGWHEQTHTCVTNWNGCIANDGNATIQLKLEGELQQDCGIWQIKHGNAKEDQVYEYDCDAVADEVFMFKEAAKGTNIVIFEMKLYGNDGKSVFTQTVFL